jgi:hypothetical protein
MAKLNFGSTFYMAFLAFGTKSRLNRGINITPYSLRYLEISSWLAFQFGFLELVGLSGTLGREGCHPFSTPVWMLEDQSHTEAWQANIRFMMLITSSGFAWRRKKASR